MDSIIIIGKSLNQIVKRQWNRGISFSYSVRGKNKQFRMSDGGGLCPSEAHGGWVGWVLTGRDTNHRLVKPLDHERNSPVPFSR